MITKFPIKHLFAAILTVLLLTGCLSRLNNRAEDGVPYEGEVTLRCTESCADYGQCGALADGRQVVLGHNAAPAVEGHTLLFSADARAVVQTSDTRMLINDLSGASFDQRFYLIAQLDTGQTGWVVEWCLVP